MKMEKPREAWEDEIDAMINNWHIGPPPQAQQQQNVYNSRTDSADDWIWEVSTTETYTSIGYDMIS